MMNSFISICCIITLAQCNLQDNIKVQGSDNLYKTPKSECNEEFTQIIKTVLESCYLDSNLDKKYVIVFGDWESCEIQSYTQSYFPLLLFNSSGINDTLKCEKYRRFLTIIKLNQTVLARKVYPVEIVCVSTDSPSDFLNFLLNFRKSIFWNSLASLFIVNKNVQDACSVSYSMLRIAWKFKMINAFYLCKTTNGHVMIYTYNPYASVASTFWNLNKILSPKSERWTLLSHRIKDHSLTQEEKDYKTCYFDRSMDVSGYTFVMSAESAIKPQNSNKFSIREHIRHDIEVFLGIMGLTLNHINATYDIKLYTYLPPTDAKGNPQSSFADIVSGKIDFSCRPDLIDEHWKMQSNFMKDSVAFIVSRKTTTSSLENILMKSDTQTFIFAVLIIALFIFLLRIILNLTWTVSFFEVIRLFTNSLERRVFVKACYASERIVLITLILVATCTSTYFLTSLKAFSTFTKFQSKFETILDLSKTDYSVYGLPIHARRYQKEVGKEIHFYHNITSCVDKLLKNERAVCITSPLQIKTFCIKESERIHISKPLRTMQYDGYHFSPDFPILPKFNQILRRMDESGLIRHSFLEPLRTLHTRHHEEIKGNRGGEVSYLVVVLYSGCGIAALIFILEFILSKCRVTRD